MSAIAGREAAPRVDVQGVEGRAARAHVAGREVVRGGLSPAGAERQIVRLAARREPRAEVGAAEAVALDPPAPLDRPLRAPRRFLEAQVAPEDIYAYHVDLIQHGRRTCAARVPLCAACPLLPRCPRAGLPPLDASVTGR